MTATAAKITGDFAAPPMPLLTGADPEAKRAEILACFHAVYSQYERLFDCLADDGAFTRRANPLRHPLIFYYGHTACFFINKLNAMRLVTERVDPRLESVLAIGVDEMSWDDLNPPKDDWPSPAEVKSFRDRAREIVDGFIRSCPITLPIKWNDPIWIVLMGIEHERIHLETSAVLMRELPLSSVRKADFWAPCRETGEAPENALLPVAGGRVRLGRDRDAAPFLYGWDNEYGRLEEEVAPFNASKYLVSNREFLRFVEAGGYETERFWTEEGWKWREFRQARHPVFWRPGPGGWRLRLMLEEVAMPWDWPAEVNELEAKAFCNWLSEDSGKSIRLPTEAEYMRLRESLAEDIPFSGPPPGNIDLAWWTSSCPVTKFPHESGFFDIIGNVWQWTESDIDALPGFEVHPAYDDFSVPTFDGRHAVFKGGCWISTGNYALSVARYAFRRHFFQNAGLRYVEAAPLAARAPNLYETDETVAQSLDAHYGPDVAGVPNYPRACAEAALALTEGSSRRKALDIGCGSGRAALELARGGFGQVDAVDFSARLIQAPVAMQASGRQKYALREEGDLQTFREADLGALGLAEAATRVRFLQGDACNLPEKFTGYDLVLAANLIDRLYDPAGFLRLIAGRLEKGGILVLTSPYDWREEFTEKEKWLGGYKRNGEAVTTLSALHEILSGEFRPLREPRDIPFALRDSARSFRRGLAQLTAWEKL
jgi:5-histidylcysteine sulfoxide synthase/putative 4-mercaptohistidine N1-methyltranferase